MLRPMPGRSLTWRFPSFCEFGGGCPWPDHDSRAWEWGSADRLPGSPTARGIHLLAAGICSPGSPAFGAFPGGSCGYGQAAFPAAQGGYLRGQRFPVFFRSWMMPWATAKRLFKVSSGVPPMPCSPAGWGSLPSTSSLRSPQGREECSPAGRCPSLLLRIGCDQW